MLISQYMSVDNDKKGTVHLYNTFDTGLAQRLAKEASEAGGGRGGEGSGEVRLMGYIPPEMWMCDPWLIMAKRARRAGDMGEYTKYVRKFFEVHREFQVITPKKYWNGSSSSKKD